MQNNSWGRLMAYVTGMVNQRLLLQCEYLVAENRIVRAHLPGKVRLSDSERRTLADIGKASVLLPSRLNILTIRGSASRI